MQTNHNTKSHNADSDIEKRSTNGGSENRKTDSGSEIPYADAAQNPSAPHVRRPHYSGKYPRKFNEKYKELHPEKYEDTIEKVIRKGSTPAGMHIPIMVDEILDVLKIKPGMTGLDCTLGYGGHSTRMLEQLHGEGHLYALDADPLEIRKTEARMRAKGFGEDIFTPIHINFANIDQVSAKYGPFDFVLADLGVSSMQIDNPERGFSYKTDGPLDLRFDPEKGEPASERMKHLTRDELTGLLIDNSDEPYAREIAEAVQQYYRRKKPLESTSQLRALIEETLKKAPQLRHVSLEEQDEAIKKSCARVFQALRIDVNSEFEVLYAFLDKLPSVLKPGGRAAILTFHSGEDRLVKQAFKEARREDLYSEISRDVTRPSREECYRNPRAHSTKLRWAIR